MKNFSCYFPQLSEGGGFYEDLSAAQGLVDIGDDCRWTANLYPAYSYDRPQPANIIGVDSTTPFDALDAFGKLNAEFVRGSSTDLFLLKDGLLFNRCLYKAHAGEIVQMYETNRPGDRGWRRDLNPHYDLQSIRQPHDVARDFFYLGSIGSENYGHWLIDDLTRSRSLLEHFSPGRLPVIILDSYDPRIDDVRAQTLLALMHGIATIEIIFINCATAYFFPRLFFVSPSSSHPILKSPRGVAFLCDHFVDQAQKMPKRDDYVRLPPGRGKRLFITRRARWRHLLNLEQVLDYFRDLSFDIIELHTHTFAEQVEIFARAEVVVGVMGAGMTNAVFSGAGTNVIHLAPDGWTDPFFWDLAALKVQRFSIAFGRIEGSEPPPVADFTIDAAQLETIKGWI